MADNDSTQKTGIDRNAWPYFATAGNPALAAFLSTVEGVNHG